MSDIKKRIELFAEDILKDDVIGLFCVSVDISHNESITGKKPPYPRVTVTAIPPEGWSNDEQKEIRKAMNIIIDVFRKKYNCD